MTSKVKNDSKSSPDEPVKRTVKQNPGATIEGVAQQVGIARSTASKVLGRLANAGEVIRHEGGREGRKRLPDRFTLKGVVLPAAYAAHVGDGASGKSVGRATNPATGKPRKRGETRSARAPRGGKEPASGGKPERLKAGGLEPLVLDYLAKNSDAAPHGASQVAKALGRSSGAVSNCLMRLTEAKQTKRVSDKPLRYDLAA